MAPQAPLENYTWQVWGRRRRPQPAAGRTGDTADTFHHFGTMDWHPATHNWIVENNRMEIITLVVHYLLIKSQATQQCRIIPAYPRTWPANRKSRVEILINRSEMICILWPLGSDWDARSIFIKIFWKTKKLDLIEYVWHLFCQNLQFTVWNPIVNRVKCSSHWMVTYIHRIFLSKIQCPNSSIKSNFFVSQKIFIKISRASQLDPARHKTLSSHWVYSTPNGKLPAFYIALGGRQK